MATKTSAVNQTQKISGEALKSRLKTASALTLPVLSFLASLTLPTYAGAVDPTATPTGENVLAGGITTERPYEGRLNVHQSTNRALIEWDSFDIGSNAWTQFYQPDSSSIAVNRVVGAGNDPTQILGTLIANGKLMVLDRNGVLFGPNSRVDVAGIVASTGDIDNALAMDETIDLEGMRGQLKNIHPGTIEISDGSEITIKDGGLAAIVAPTVINRGTITATLGKVELAGEAVTTVDTYGDGLVEFEVTNEGKKVIVENSGVISAEGGVISMTTKGAEQLMDSVINMSGVATVASATMEGGKIVLGGNSATVNVSGTVDASGTKGGTVKVTGDDINVASSAELNAIATAAGQDGGTIEVIAKDHLQFAGHADVSGGQGGEGGFIDTSGLNTVAFEDGFTVTTGQNGDWLIDPTNININAALAGQISTNLNSGNVTVNTNAAPYGGAGADAGIITVGSSIFWMGTGNLLLIANNNINFTTGVQIISANTLGTGTQGSVGLLAGGDINMYGADILTNRGNIGMQASGTVNIAGTTGYDSVINSQQGGQIDILGNSLFIGATGTDSLTQIASAGNVNLVSATTITLNSGADASSMTQIASTAGDTKVFANGSIVIGGNAVNNTTITGANVGILADADTSGAGSLTLSNGSFIGATGGTWLGGNSIDLNGGNVVGSVLTLASANAITQNAGAKIFAGGLVGSAGGNVSLSGATNEIGLLGDFAVTNGSFTLNDTTDGLGVIGDVTASGNVNVTTVGDLTVTGNAGNAAEVKSTGGNINLTGTNVIVGSTTGANNGTKLTTTTGDILLTGNNVTIQSGSDTTSKTEIAAGNIFGTLANNNTTISAGAAGTTTVDAAIIGLNGDLDVSGTGDVVINNGVDIQSTQNTYLAGKNIALNGGAITAAGVGATATGGITQDSDSIIATGLLEGSAGTGANFGGTANAIGKLGNFAAGNGALILKNNNATMDLTGTISAMGGDINIANAGGYINLASTGGLTTFNGNILLSGTDLILAGSTFTTLNTVLEATTGSITQTGGALTVGNNLNVLAGTSASLTSSGNQIGKLKTVTTNGDFTLNDGGAGGLEVNGTINTQGGNIDIDTVGNFSLTNGQVNANGGNVDIDQTGTFAALADTIKTSGTGTISLWQRVGGSIANAVASFLNTGSGANTLDVAAGTYNEAASINIDENNFTLRGAKAGIDARLEQGNRVYDGAGETIIDLGNIDGRMITITADNVTIDGFQIQNSFADMVYANHASGLGDVNGNGSWDNLSVINNLIRDAGDEGVQLRDTTNANLQYNNITDTRGDALNLADLSNNGFIRDNEIYGTSSDNAQIYIYNSTNITVQNNYIHDIIAPSNDGIKMGNKDGSDGNKFIGNVLNNRISNVTQDGIAIYSSNSTVSGNEISGSGSNNGAIHVNIKDSNDPVPANIVIQNNYIHDNTTRGVQINRATNVSVQGNTFNNNTTHVSVGSLGNAAQTTVSDNSFGASTGVAVANSGTNTLKADNNWWNTTTAADVAGRTAGTVDFSTYLGLGTDADGAAAGFQGDHSNLYVTSLGAQTGLGGRIADAIATLADGSDTGGDRTVTVTAGTYGENVTVNKAMTLQGMGGTSIIDGTGRNGHGITVAASDVTLDGLVTQNFVNSYVADDYTASGIFVNSAITNLTLNEMLTRNNAAGFYVSKMASINGLDIDDSQFNNNNFGFYTEKNMTLGTTDTVTDVTVDGSEFNGNRFKGLYIEKLNDATFTNVDVIGSAYDPANANANVAVELNLKNGAYENITFDNLSISGGSPTPTAAGKAGVGISVKARNDSPSYSAAPASLSNFTLENSNIDVTNGDIAVMISHNVDGVSIDNNILTGPQGVTAFGDVSNVSVTGNTITTVGTSTGTLDGSAVSVHGIRFSSIDGTNTISDNDLTGQTTGTGVYLDATSTVDTFTGNSFKGYNQYIAYLNGSGDDIVVGSASGNTFWTGAGYELSGDMSADELFDLEDLITHKMDNSAYGRVMFGAPGNFYVTVLTGIQNAINAANDGDTINVDKGTYNESVTVNKDVTLRGYRAGESAIGRTGDESIVDPNSPGFHIVVDGVTLDGFAITDATGADGYGVWIENADDVQVLNNLISNTSQAGLYGLNSDTLTLSGNAVNTALTGIVVSGGNGLTLGAFSGTGLTNATGIDVSGATGDITMSGAINVGAKNTNLSTTGAIVQAAGTLTTNTLTGAASGANFGGTNNVRFLGAFATGADGFTLNNANSRIDVSGAVTSTGGDIDIRNTQQMRLLASGSLVSGGGDISFLQSQASLYFIDGTINAGAGDVTLTSQSNIALRNTSAITADVLTVNSGAGITQDATSTIIANTLTGTADNAVNFAGTNNNLVNLGDFVTGASNFNTGGFRLNDSTGGLTITGDVSSDGGAIVISSTGAQMTQNETASIVSGGGDITLNGGDSGINLRGITNAGAGDVSLTGRTINLSHTGTTSADNLSLVANVLTVGQTANHTINATTLTGSAGRTATLAGPNNLITNLGAFATGTASGQAGGFVLNDSDGGLTVTGNVSTQGGAIDIDTAKGDLTLNAGTSMTSNGGNISLTANDPDVVVNGAINAGAGNVDLSGDNVYLNNGSTVVANTLTTNAVLGVVSQQAGSTITVTTLTGSAADEADFASTTNAVRYLGNFATGNGGFALNNAINRMDINGAVTSTGGNIDINNTREIRLLGTGSLASGGGDIDITNSQAAFFYIDGTINAGTGDVSLDSKSNINLRNTSTITADAVTVNSGNIVNQDATSTIIANTLTGTVDKTATFAGTNNNLVNLGTFLTGASNFHDGGFSLNEVDGLNVTGLVSADGGNITLDVGGDLAFTAGGAVEADGGNVLLDQTGVFSSVDANSVSTSGTGTITMFQNDGGSIGNAISAMNNTGTGLNTLTVGAGTYNESVLVDQANLLLRGANYGVAGFGARGAESQVNPNSPGFHITADNVELNGFAVAGATGADGYGVWVDNADNVEILNNVISTSEQSGIRVQDSDNTDVFGNSLNANGIGVHVRNSTNVDIGSGTLATDLNRNVITGSTTDGIRVRNGDNVNVVNNTINTSGEDGIDVEDTTGTVNVSYNRVTGTTGGNGIRVRGIDDAQITNNVLRSVGQNGIFVQGGEGVDILSNNISGTATTSGAGANGIYVLNGRDAVINGNVIAGGNGSGNTTGKAGSGLDGIHVENNRGVEIASNTVRGGNAASGTFSTGNGGTGAGGDGIHVTGSQEAYIHDNTIAAGSNNLLKVGGRGANGNGIAAIDNAATGNRDGVYIDNNDILGNLRVQGAGANGILVVNSGHSGSGYEAVVLNSTITNVGQDGIKIEATDDLRVQSAVITRTGGDGIDVSTSNSVMVADNSTNLTTSNGIRITDSNDAYLGNNDVTNAGGHGIGVTNSDDVGIVGNRIGDGLMAGATLDGINVTGGKKANISMNVIRGGLLLLAGAGDNGIEVVNNREASITFNQILGGAIAARGATNNGIYVSNSGAQGSANRNGVVVSNNIVSGTALSNGAGDDGIVVINSGGGDNADDARILNNTVKFAGDDAVDVSNSTNVDVSGNIIDDITNAGIRLANVVRTLVSGNDIDDADTGVTVANSDDVEIDFNQIVNVDTGIYADTVSQLLVTENTIDGRTGNGRGDYGIYVTGSDNAVIGGQGGTNINYVQDFDQGINVVASNGARIRWNDVSEFDTQGIVVSGSDDVRIRRNTVYNGTGEAILVSGGQDAIVDRNDVDDVAGSGIFLSSTTNSQVTRNTVTDATDNGIYGFNLSGGNISQNTVDNAAGMTTYGVNIVGSNGVTIGDSSINGTNYTGNVVSGGTEAGIRVNGGSFNFVTANNLTDATDADDAADYGVELLDTTFSFATGNTIAGRKTGVQVDGGDSNQVDQNILTGNGTAIRVIDATNTDVINHATIDGNGTGIEVTGTATGTLIDNNIIDNSTAYGIRTSGSDVGTVTLTDNTLTNNTVGIRLESGLIDMSSLTDENIINTGTIGLQMEPVVGFEGNLVLAGNTLGATKFVEQASYAIELLDGAYFVGGTPFVIDALNVSFTKGGTVDFVPANSPYGPGILTLAQLQALEAMIFDLDDLIGRGQIFVGTVPGLDESDLFPNGLGTFGTPGAGFQLTILGLPTIPGGAGQSNLGSFLNNITPFAGGDGSAQSLANIAPAAGGDASDLNAIAPASGETVSCWSQVGSAMGANAAVSYNFSNSSADAMDAAAACGG